MHPLKPVRLAALVLLSILAAGCQRTPASKELAALERAYQAGVLTKGEYETKRAALETQASALSALDKALEAGILGKDEYQARKSQLLAQAGAVAALERAYRAGVFTRDEYLAKKAALLAPGAAVPPPPRPPAEEIASPAPAPVPETVPASGAAQPVTAGNSAPDAGLPAPPATPAAPEQGHVLRLRMVKAVDQYGFERPMTSATMLVPTDWQAQGGTVWNIKDKCNTIQTNLRTSGPDGRAVEIFPAYTWVWADDPRPLQATAAQTAQFGTRPCEVMPPMRAADFLRRNLSRYRPNAQVVALEPAPKVLEVLQQMARRNEQSAARYNLRQSVRPDVVRARIRYTVNGQAMEEWITVSVIVTATLGPSFDTRTMRQIQAYSYNCAAYATGERAPQGQLDANEKFFDLLAGTYRQDPSWQAKVSGNAQAIQQIELKGVRDRSAIVAKNADDIRNIQREGFEGRQRTLDQISEQRSQTTRGVETYRNPATGETVELSNQYGNAWVNNRGEYLLSDQPGFDPAVTLKEDWRPLEHVK